MPGKLSAFDVAPEGREHSVEMYRGQSLRSTEQYDGEGGRSNGQRCCSGIAGNKDSVFAG